MTTLTIESRWPALDAPRRRVTSALRTRVARRLFSAAVRRLNVSVELRNADEVNYLGRGGPTATVNDPDEFFARLGHDGLIGFGEAFMNGAWDSDQLVDYLTVLASHMSTLISPRLQRLRALAVRRIPRRHRNTRSGALRNIAHHYDLSNDLFSLFLDPTMTYSAALFEAEAGRPIDAGSEAALRQAQHRKIERLLDQAGVGSGTHLLEIGTGWGELAIHAARRGATVLTLTLSSEQQELATQRVEAAGFGDQVTVELCDYRDAQGTFDAVISVEMIEAVGWQFWPTYFEKVDALLRPGGRFALQAITMPHDRMLATRDTHTWITKYIFPGGALPSARAIQRIVDERTSLKLQDRLDFGLHYAATLRLWAASFVSADSDVADLGFDSTFRRMWLFYLAYCEAGFASGYIDVNQLTFVKEQRT